AREIELRVIGSPRQRATLRRRQSKIIQISALSGLVDNPQALQLMANCPIGRSVFLTRRLIWIAYHLKFVVDHGPENETYVLVFSAFGTRRLNNRLDDNGF